MRKSTNEEAEECEGHINEVHPNVSMVTPRRDQLASCVLHKVLEWVQSLPRSFFGRWEIEK